MEERVHQLMMPFICAEIEPEEKEIAPGHLVSCHLY
jgi:hypothetical protein